MITVSWKGFGVQILRSKNPEILLLYKRSSFLATKGLPSGDCSASDRFRLNHINHYESLRKIELALRKKGLSFKKHCRSKRVDYRTFDLVITVGGDGTFLEAARKLGKDQYILGVNSDPHWSVGRFCSCSADGFSHALHKILQGNVLLKRLSRLKLCLSGLDRPIECLNDILVCHPNPAAMSRYHIRIGRNEEEQRSSGIWLSTASGSTGAILSAGGKKMPLESRGIQYKPRELYQVPHKSYVLTGSLLAPGKKVTLVSHMPHGSIFMDGAHIKFPFAYGAKAEVSISPNCVNMIHVR